MSKAEIKTTALNAMETISDLKDLFSATMKLLGESYAQDYLTFHKEMIVNVLDELRVNIAREQVVMVKYKELGLDVVKDKANTMRTLMQHFNKKDSAFVYTTLMKNI